MAHFEIRYWLLSLFDIPGGLPVLSYKEYKDMYKFWFTFLCTCADCGFSVLLIVVSRLCCDFSVYMKCGPLLSYL